MKRVLVTIIFIILTAVMLFLPFNYLVKPGINKLEKSNEVKITKEDILIKEKEINDKYLELDKDIDRKYQDLMDEANKKYDDLIKDLDNKYTDNMFDDNWYKDSVDKMNEESSINTKRNLEISDLSKAKVREKFNLSKEKTDELDLLKYSNNDSIKLLIIGIVYIVLGVMLDFTVVSIIISKFNTLIKANNMVKESLSNIDIMLKKRNDLIPNLVEVVKGYTKHEEKTLKEVIEARNKSLKASDPKDLLETSKDLDNKIDNLFALVESYPDLKANKNYLDLQDKLVELEDNIARMRIQYNRSVLRYKNYVEMFPSNIIAIICNFKKEQFYEIKDEERENVKVSL